MRPTERPAKPYTRAEIAARIRQHFMTEGHPRCYAGTKCKYSDTPNGGQGCAVGCMITAEDARVWDGCSPNTIAGLCIWNRGGIRVYFNPEDIQLLEALQRAHDKSKVGHSELVNALEAVLHDYGL